MCIDIIERIGFCEKRNDFMLYSNVNNLVRVLLIWYKINFFVY